MPQGYAATLDGRRDRQSAQVTDLNENLIRKPTGRVEIIQWKGARDERSNGILSYPLDWKAGEKHPLILIPTAARVCVARSMDQQLGRAVHPLAAERRVHAEPNYHGSANYGLIGWNPSAAATITTWNSAIWKNGVADLDSDRGLVDPDKLGVGGWSNGRHPLRGNQLPKDRAIKGRLGGAASADQLWLMMSARGCPPLLQRPRKFVRIDQPSVDQISHAVFQIAEFQVVIVAAPMDSTQSGRNWRCRDNGSSVNAPSAARG